MATAENPVGTEIDVAADLTARLEKLQRGFRERGPMTYHERRDALNTLLDAIQSRKRDYINALNEDFGGRAEQDSMLLDLFPVVDEIRHTLGHLKGWMKTKRVAPNWQFIPGKCRVQYQPLGVVGIIGAWNYQVQLSFSPLVNAIAAGNHAMIKPSELAPITAQLMQDTIADIFPDDFVTVVNGGPDVSASFSSLPFDHLIFTGSPRVGKLIMRAASENLTPVTLELGGKSPALIHPDANMKVAANRILSGKFWNGSQTCVAPDYVLVHEEQLGDFLDVARDVLPKRYPSLVNNPDFTRVMAAHHYTRLADIVEDAREKGAEVLQFNPANEDCNVDNKVLPPTLLYNVNDDMTAMQEELFGPVLPIKTYQTQKEALDYINDNPRPLALYYFDKNRKRINEVIRSTISGGVTINDVIFHFVQHNMPVGGVGNSGMGAYHGFDGFATFSKKKPIYYQPRMWSLTQLLYPPYGKLATQLLNFLLKNWR